MAQAIERKLECFPCQFPLSWLSDKGPKGKGPPIIKQVTSFKSSLLLKNYLQHTQTLQLN